MTATHWLLAGIAVLCVMCLVAVMFCKMINTEWQRADEPVYRTADANAIRQQTHRIIANASAHKGTHTSVPASAHPVNEYNPHTTRREGTAAALADLGRKPGTPATANPHAADTLAHFVWRDAYNRASTVYQYQAVP